MQIFRLLPLEGRPPWRRGRDGARPSIKSGNRSGRPTLEKIGLFELTGEIAPPVSWIAAGIGWITRAPGGIPARSGIIPPGKNLVSIETALRPTRCPNQNGSMTCVTSGLPSSPILVSRMRLKTSSGQGLGIDSVDTPSDCIRAGMVPWCQQTTMSAPT